MRSGRILFAFALGAIAAGVAVIVETSRSGAQVASAGKSPAQLTARSNRTKHFEYVASTGAVYVYSINHRNRLVQTIGLPWIGNTVHGMVASPRTRRLYISYGEERPPGGSLLAYDLRRGRVLWRRTYAFGIDSMAISADGRWIYMPAGEQQAAGTWRIIAGLNGKPTGRTIDGPGGAHNTILGPDGHSLYLGGVDYPYLEVVDTATNQVLKKIGPLNPPGVRPFTINGSQTLAFTTASSFLGFQVSSIATGAVLYTAPIAGFSFDPKTFQRTPNHGISLSPDERRLYLIDTPNGYVHVFDVSGLPASAPRLVANIKLHHAPPNDGWLLQSRAARSLSVGRSGDFINPRPGKIFSSPPPPRATADSLEIDGRRGTPVATTSRYGVGYRP